MRLLDHLRELQTRLVSALAAVAVLVALFFTCGARRVRWVVVPWPSVDDSVAAAAFRALARQFTPPGVELVVISPLDGAMSTLVVAVALGVAGALPVIAWHAVSYVRPALAVREKAVAARAIPAVVALFGAGVAFGWFLVLPVVFTALYGYAAALEARLLLSVGSLVTFAAILLLVFGLSFQLPIVMMALSRLGLVAPVAWVRGWRHAVLAIVLVAAIVTPDPTVVSQMFVAVPLLGLYALGAAGAWFSRQASAPAPAPSPTAR